jgi:hypothetical protein
VGQTEEKRKLTHPRTTVEEEEEEDDDEDDDGRWAGRGKVGGIEAAGGSCSGC